MYYRLSFLLCLIITFINGPKAQTSIQSPNEFLHYQLGSRFTPHHQLVEYFRYVAAQSDRVQLVDYGQTYELRPLIAAIISSPENLKRIESIRQNNLRRTGLLQGNVTNENIALVHLSYSVHGNEAAGSESSMAVLHKLATDNGDINTWLQNTVVIMDPALNPDGYSRYTNWNNQVSSKINDPINETREHSEPWPGGRVNHYYYDLNRDWAWMTQKETRDRIKFYLQWMPHIHADLHEMFGENSYYFAPAAQPYHPYLSKWQSDFQHVIGRNHAGYFDQNGWRYFTKEYFDLFYPSYGDTYPMLSGAIGMTYEQSGHGLAGRAFLMTNGDTLKLSDRIAHHYTTSLSTIEIASKNASRIVAEFEKYYEASNNPVSGKNAAYIIDGANHPGKIADLVKLLKGQGIQFGFPKDAGKNIRAIAFENNESDDHNISYKLKENDLIIPLAQPRSVLLNVLFEKEARLEDSLTYDITAWSIPMAYGLNTYLTKESIEISSLANLKVNQLSPDARPYAYALSWGSVPSAKLLGAFLNEGLTARYAMHDFKIGTQFFPKGTILFMRADNRNHPEFDLTIIELANESIVPVNAIATGFVDEGKDMGSDFYPLIRKPNVLTIAGSGVNSQSIGQIWHFFEEELDYPVHIINADQLSSVDLDAYNVVLLPEGYYNVDNNVTSAIKTWCQKGGQLIVLGSAINKLSGAGFSINTKNGSSADKVPESDPAHFPETYESGQRKSISDDIGGAVFKTRMDPSHPLTFGLGEVYYTMKTNPSSFQWLASNGNAIYLDDKPLYYGFAGKKALEKVKKSLIAGRENIGGGGVVYFVDNPLFRSFWNSGKVLFSNALFFG